MRNACRKYHGQIVMFRNNGRGVATPAARLRFLALRKPRGASFGPGLHRFPVAQVTRQGGLVLPIPTGSGRKTPQDNQIWGTGRVELASVVTPKSQAVFGFTITAPSTPGTYSFSWGMLREGAYWFGPVASTTITVTAPSPVYDAQVVSANVPSRVTAGSYYNVSLTLKNTGNVTWTTPDYLLANPDDNMIWGVNRVSMNTSSVAPGQNTTFSFQMRAPTSSGTYPFQWGMVWEYHQRFGQTSTTYIVVDPVTSTPAPTISASHTAMTAGQAFSMTWGTSNATSLVHTCSAGGTGYTVNESLAVNGSRTMTAQSGWVNYPSTCTWTASGAGGTATYTETMTTAAGSTASNGVTYIHTDGLGSPVARTDANGQVVSRTSYEPYGYVAAGTTPTIGFTGHVNDADTGLTYMQQRYYDPVAGRFLSNDPVAADVLTGSNFNRYSYVNNNPYSYVDPDGRNAIVVGFVGGATVLAVGAWKYATDPQARAVMNRAFDVWRNHSGPKRSDSADASKPNKNSPPPVPSDLVGDQSDPRAGPSNSGKRHTSGPLTPENGGTGDAEKDFDKLTGGTGKPFPDSDGRSKIPGAQVGDNGVWIRPGTKNPGDGPRIEIPGNDNKLPETLHY
nr:RHS repeat-associated core domain-containing protein [Massilia sp. YIM B02763]